MGDITRIFGVSARKVARIEKSLQPLTVNETTGLCRLRRVACLATELLGDIERATTWLKTRNAYLGNATPLAMLQTDIGAETVLESLSAIANGGVA